MQTYILISNGLYKIGRSIVLEERMKAYETHNPSFTLLKVIDCDCETFLHRHFSNKWVKNEWFSLSEEDFKWIIDNENLLLEIATSTKIDIKLIEGKTKTEIRKEYFKRAREEARAADREQAYYEYLERIKDSPNFGVQK